MRRIRPRTVAGALALAVLTAGLVSGCSNSATTSNAITPGPKLPAGYSAPKSFMPGYPVSTPSLSPTP